METRDLIFVVDDSEVFLSLFTESLSKNKNYKVISFSDGLKMLRDLYLKPRAILLDYYLDSKNKNALNGKEVLEIMKLMKKKLPVIVFSGSCQPEKVSEIKQMGIVDFFYKGTHNFLEKIERAMERII